MKIIGITVLIVGLFMTLYTGFNYVTREKVVDLGPIELMADRQHDINWEPFVGVLIMIAGGFVLFLDRKTPIPS
jgi:hypothetical protein